jgi:hypothetical protein
MYRVDFGILYTFFKTRAYFVISPQGPENVWTGPGFGIQSPPCPFSS